MKLDLQIQEIFEPQKNDIELTVKSINSILTLKERTELTAEYELCNGFTFVWRFSHKERTFHRYIFSLRYIILMPQSQRRCVLLKKFFRNFFHDRAINNDDKKELLEMFAFYIADYYSSEGSENIEEFIKNYLKGYLGNADF